MYDGRATDNDQKNRFLSEDLFLESVTHERGLVHSWMVHSWIVHSWKLVKVIHIRVRVGAQQDENRG